jgi:hypothetical protein
MSDYVSAEPYGTSGLLCTSAAWRQILFDGINVFERAA